LHLLGLGVAVVVIATLYLARVVLVPFALAMLLSFLLTPVVIFLERLLFPRVLAVSLVVILFIAALGSVGWAVTNQLVDVTSQLTSYKANIKNKIESVRGIKGQGLDKATDAVKELGKELDAEPANGPEAGKSGKLSSSQATAASERPVSVEVVPPPSNLLEYAGSALGPLGTTAIAIVFTIFILLRREDLRNRFIRLAGRGRLSVMTHALDEAAERVSRYVFLQFLVNVCYGAVVSIVLYFIGIPNALLWGVGAGILRFLPYVGPPIGAALPILLSLAVFDGWTKAIFTIGFFVTIELVVSNLVEPSLYGAHTGISPLAILFAAVFWTMVWGPIGLVLSTPLTVCLVVMGRHVPHLEFLQVILGDDPVLPPEEMFYQRLLATDQNEAKAILEGYLKDNSLEDLYDSVLIPALGLAEQDRHRNELDEATEVFISQSIKELVEEANDRSKEQLEQSAKEAQEAKDATNEKDVNDAKERKSKPPASASPPEASPNDPSMSPPHAKGDNGEIYVVCMPARDEADEIVGTMLAHLLDRAGYRTNFIEVGTSAEMLAQVLEEKPSVVCLSALPPFAMAHARRLYRALRAQSPDLKIVVGLWNGAVDPNRTAVRISGLGESQVSRTLAEAVLQVKVLTEIVLQTSATSV
jgi:predicted PurR-regulated permease PerM